MGGTNSKASKKPNTPPKESSEVKEKVISPTTKTIKNEELENHKNQQVNPIVNLEDPVEIKREESQVDAENVAKVEEAILIRPQGELWEEQKIMEKLDDPVERKPEESDKKINESPQVGVKEIVKFEETILIRPQGEEQKTNLVNETEVETISGYSVTQDEILNVNQTNSCVAEVIDEQEFRNDTNQEVIQIEKKDEDFDENTEDSPKNLDGSSAIEEISENVKQEFTNDFKKEDDYILSSTTTDIIIESLPENLLLSEPIPENLMNSKTLIDEHKQDNNNVEAVVEEIYHDEVCPDEIEEESQVSFVVRESVSENLEAFIGNYEKRIEKKIPEEVLDIELPDEPRMEACEAELEANLGNEFIPEPPKETEIQESYEELINGNHIENNEQTNEFDENMNIAKSLVRDTEKKINIEIILKKYFLEHFAIEEESRADLLAKEFMQNWDFSLESLKPKLCDLCEQLGISVEDQASLELNKILESHLEEINIAA